jgi:hypothetical protein
MSVKARFTVKLELTDYGKTQAVVGSMVKIFGKWIGEFEMAKKNYVEMGYEIVSEDVEKGEFIVEK